MGKIFLFLLFFFPLLGQNESPERKEQLYLSMNIGEGDKLELSDGSTYQLDPQDKLFASYWITPIPIMLSESKDPDYPVKITNLNTGTSVNGKKISTRDYLREEYEIDQERRQPPPQEPRNK